MKSMGFGQAVKDVENGICPKGVGCGKQIKMSDFRDALSIKEFRISGLCQNCQDSVFGE